MTDYLESLPNDALPLDPEESRTLQMLAASAGVHPKLAVPHKIGIVIAFILVLYGINHPAVVETLQSSMPSIYSPTALNGFKIVVFLVLIFLMIRYF